MIKKRGTDVRNSVIRMSAISLFSKRFKIMKIDNTNLKKNYGNDEEKQYFYLCCIYYKKSEDAQT